MHVWSEGATHRVVLHQGLAVGQLWRGRAPGAPRTFEGAALMTGALQRMLAQGIRPLGVILDVAAVSAPALATSRPLANLLVTLDRLNLPVAVLAGRRPEAAAEMDRLVAVAAARRGRVVRTVQEAERWARGERTPVAVAGTISGLRAPGTPGTPAN